jgi:hypothetical protein
MKVIKPPAPLEIPTNVPSIFLAGSIEMGVAVDWQREVEHQLSSFNVTLLNPRRDQFDAKAEQKISNPYFYGQVTWELEALERADLIIMYFAPDTKAPVTLLELGLHAKSGKVIVCCPVPYWRKGNVDIVCERYKVPVVNTLEDLIDMVKARINL